MGQARRPRIVSKQEGDADSRGRGFAICDLLLRPFNAVGSGRASEGLSPATTWGVARGAAQTSMQGTAVLWRRVTREEVTRMIVEEWDGGKRKRERLQ